MSDYPDYSQALAEVTAALDPLRGLLALEGALKTAAKAQAEEAAHLGRMAELEALEAAAKARIDNMDADVQACADRRATILGEAHAEAERITKAAADEGQRTINAHEIQAKALIEDAQRQVADIHAAARRATTEANLTVAEAQEQAHAARTRAAEAEAKLAATTAEIAAAESRLAAIREAIAAAVKV